VRRPHVTQRSVRAAPRVFLIGFALAVLCGIFLRAYHVERKVFWEDEALGAMHMLGYTEAEIVRVSPSLPNAAALQSYLVLPPNDSFGATVRSLALEDPQHPPLYYVLTHAWVRIFGPSVASLRWLSVLFGILVLPCAFWLARELFEAREVALTFTALVAVSPLYVLYAQEAREYSLWTVTTLLLCIAFLRARRTRSIIDWVLYAAAFALGLYVYPLTGLVALGMGLYVLFVERGRRNKTLGAFLVSTLAGTVAFAPWLTTMLTSPGLRRGMAVITSGKLSAVGTVFLFLRNVRSAIFDFGAFRLGPLGSTVPNALLVALAVLLAGYALCFLVRNAPVHQWGFVLFALCVPFTLLVVKDLTGHGLFVYQARYFIPLFIGLELALAFTFAHKALRPGSGWQWRAALAAVLLGGAASCLVSSQARTWWNKGYERSPDVAAIVNRAGRPLVVSDYFTPSILDLSRYLRPDVALRLNLKCAQCTLPARERAPSEGAPGDVFVLGIPPDSSARSGRWIDPRPFPRQADPLNMFAAL